MSPQELEGKYTVALRRIDGTDLADRHKPIYQRNPRNTEDEAIEEAASALRALWKLRLPVRP